MSAESQPVFEPRGAETWRDPFGMYKALRDHDPVHHVPDNGEGEDYWVLSRFGHVIDAAVDAGTFSSAQGLTFSYGEMEKVGIEAPIVMMDPPEHTSLRKLSVKKFTPQQVTELEPLVREFVVERVERLREQGEGDVVEALGRRFESDAELLEVRVGTVKSRIFRARLALRQMVESIRAARLGPSEAKDTKG